MTGTLRARILAMLFVVMTPCAALASGHGPVFGASTPVLGKGGWQLDQAWFGRMVDGPQTDEQLLRTMISFGITEDLQISGSLPIRLETSVLMPRGRMVSMMSSVKEIEASAAWRFHRRVTGVGTRFESTVSGGVGLPLEEYSPDGMRTAPSAHVSAATGYVSRGQYIWVGGGYQQHRKTDFEQVGSVTYVSAVYGYRPRFLRLDYPKPDLRFFVEAMAERTERGKHFGLDMLSSGGDAVFVGPTALLLYKAYAIEGGVMFPAYQRTTSFPERRRFAVNVSYFFWHK
jgi:hypothetical protein